MCALTKTKTYTVKSDHAELAKGSRFSVRPGPVKSGQLCLFKVRDLLIVGRWYRDSIIQPKRWIFVSNPASVRILGAVEGRDA
jgi:hypothetical protein